MSRLYPIALCLFSFLSYGCSGSVADRDETDTSEDPDDPMGTSEDPDDPMGTSEDPDDPALAVQTQLEEHFRKWELVSELASELNSCDVADDCRMVGTSPCSFVWINVNADSSELEAAIVDVLSDGFGNDDQICSCSCGTVSCDAGRCTHEIRPLCDAQDLREGEQMICQP